MNTATPEGAKPPATEDVLAAEKVLAAAGDSVTVELWVRKDIYGVALTKANSQGERLSAVARASLFAAAAEAKPLTGWIIVRDDKWIGGKTYPNSAAAIAAGNEAFADAGEAWTVYSVDAPEVVALGVLKPKPRTYGEERERIRFKVPMGTKRDATKRIEDSGESVPAALERYLLSYIEHGTIAHAK
jgi:hypothetical protein